MCSSTTGRQAGLLWVGLVIPEMCCIYSHAHSSAVDGELSSSAVGQSAAFKLIGLKYILQILALAVATAQVTGQVGCRIQKESSGAHCSKDCSV